MKRTVISPLSIQLDKAALMEENHIPADSDLAEEFSDLIDAAQQVLCCKMILLEAEPGLLPLPDNIQPRFFYAMTIGTEIEADEDCDYPVLGDIVRQAALDKAMIAAKHLLQEQYGLQNVVFYNPGSAEGWAQTANTELFRLLDAAEIGLTCDDRGYMKPWYSTLGVFTEV